MAIKTNFLSGQSYPPEDLSNQWKSLIDNGVFNFALGGLLVSANSPADLSINIAAGECSINGKYTKSDAIENISITANTSGFNRIDSIVVDIDVDNSLTTIKAVEGIPSSSPVAPVITENQLLLADILVGNNVSVLDDNVITDKRVNVDILDASLSQMAQQEFIQEKLGLIGGNQLIRNGAFATGDISEWATLYSPTLSVVGSTSSGESKSLTFTATTSNDQCAYQFIDTGIGRTYTISCLIYNVDSARGSLFILNDDTWVKAISTKSGEWELLKITVVAKSTTIKVHIGAGS